MTDKYYVYRPILNLLGISEGTDKGDGYNETLGYGAYTGGDVNLVSMTLEQIAALQAKMLKHPKNDWNSSAVGRYQIVSKTMRGIIDTLGLSMSDKFDEDMQDRMACYLLGVRGIDKWLAGRLSDDTMINNLSWEWASLPKTDGKGRYGGQRSAVIVAQVMQTLSEVRERHMSGQPVQKETKIVVPDPGELSTPPIKSKTVWQWVITTLLLPLLAAVSNPYVQGLIIVVIACFAVYAIKRRSDLFKEASRILLGAKNKPNTRIVR